MSEQTKAVPYKPYNILVMDVKAFKAINDPTPIPAAQSEQLANILKACTFQQEDNSLVVGAGFDVNNGLRQHLSCHFTIAENPDKSVFRFIRALLIHNPFVNISFMVAEVDRLGQVLEASRMSGRICRVSNPASGHPDNDGRQVQIEITGLQDFSPEMEKQAAGFIVSENLIWVKA